MRYTTSVVIPCYLPRASANDVQMLHKAILSAVTQDYPDQMEIILVDDGNPVPVERLIDIASYPCEVRVIHQPRNMGLVLALNKGITEAKYNFIARLDADDTWAQGKISAQFERFTADPELTLVGTGMVRVTPEGEIIDEHIRPDGWTNIARFFVEYGCPFPHGSVLARKDIYKELGLYSQDATFAHCEDYHLWGQWIRFFKTAIIEKSYYNYTVSNASVSAQNSEQQMKASQIVLHHFRAISVDSLYIDAIEKISEILSINKIELGILLHSIWRSANSVIRMPVELIEYFVQLFPDRCFLAVNMPQTRKFEILQEDSKFSKLINVFTTYS